MTRWGVDFMTDFSEIIFELDHSVLFHAANEVLQGRGVSPGLHTVSVLVSGVRIPVHVGT